MRLKKEPKVHRYEKRRKERDIVGPGRTLLSICFTFVVAGAIGVLGYSIAKPILQFSSKDSETETLSVAETNVITTPPVTTSSTTITTTTAATTEIEEVVTIALRLGVRLDSEALNDLESLQNAITAAKEAQPDLSFLVLPLKIEGGAVLYQTDVELAKNCGAVQGSLTLDEIISTVKQAELIPIAECSLLNDCLLPDGDASAGYVIASSGSRWLDNSPENGGLPWANPFSDVTVTYLTDLTTELAVAGFSQIWCCDVNFPSFRSSDLELIGETVQDENCGEVLTELLNTLANAVNVPLMFEADGNALIDGTVEAFRPEELELSGIVLDLDASSMLEKLMDWKEANASDWNTVLLLPSDSFSKEMIETEIDETISGWAIYE